MTIGKTKLDLRQYSADELSNEDYHADPAISSTMLRTFLRDRREFEAVYIDGAVEEKMTDAMDKGTRLHTRILEPELWQRMIAPPYPDKAPDGKKWLRRKGSDHEKWWAEEVEKRRGLIAATQESLELTEAQAHAVARNRFAHELLYGNQGQVEHSLVWRDEATGLDCKCRWDWFATIGADIKTAADPSPGAWAHQAGKLKYHVQSAHYKAGARAFGFDCELLHIVVRNALPTWCAVYRLDDVHSGVPVGEMQWRSALNDLSLCLQSGDWSNPAENQVASVKLPRRYHEDWYAIGGSDDE